MFHELANKPSNFKRIIYTALYNSCPMTLTDTFYTYTSDYPLYTFVYIDFPFVTMENLIRVQWTNKIYIKKSFNPKKKLLKKWM